MAQGDISSTKKFGCTGLGLTISNSLLALIGNILELTSEVHKEVPSHLSLSQTLRYDYSFVSRGSSFTFDLRSRKKELQALA